jgi:hypothetical protein
MANQTGAKQRGQGEQTGQGKQGNQERGSFPLDNLTYNIVTVLYEKSKGLEAINKYLNDAQNEPELRELFEQMRDQEEHFIQQLHQQLISRSNQQGQTARK